MAEWDGALWGHRPHLDGLRVVAVYLVVAFHAGLDRLTGGFVGVDVFFVLSGYLVTSVMLRDVGEGGRVRLARFYARRVRRLLPASAVTLATTVVVYGAVADVAAVETARRSAQAAFVYLANWFFIRESAEYFATERDANPILHFWSLAVEEQFYLVWPLLLTGLVVVARRLPGSARRWLQAAVCGGALVSVILALAWRNSAPDRAYFGTDTRAYQLLAGALLALSPGAIRRLARSRLVAEMLAAVALVALIVVASSAISVGPVVRGVLAAAAALSLVAATEASASGLVSRAAGLRPVVRLGQISYGTYLWHWPVLVVVREVRPMSDRADFALAAVVATALASLSFDLLEQPIRTWPRLDRRPAPLVAAGLATGVLAAVVVVPNLPGEEGSGPVRPAVAVDSELAQHLNPVPASYSSGDVYFGNSTDVVTCVDRPVTDCTVQTGTGPHLFLMGDSSMHAVVPAFVELARRHDLTLSLGTRPGCPWPRGNYPLGGHIESDCRTLKEDVYERVLPSLRPDVVVLLDSGPLADVDPTEPAESVGSAEYREAVEASVPVLADLAGTVVVVDPLPKISPLLDPRTCLDEVTFVEQCRFVVPPGRTWMEELYREVAEEEANVSVVDLDRLACPALPVCEAIVDGRAVWVDGQHIASGFAVTWADDLHRELAAIGVLPPER